MKHSFLSMLFLLACTDSQTCSTLNKIPVDKEVQLIEPVKSFNNPAIIYGTDFITFLAMLQLTEVSNTDTLLYYTSAISKAKYGKEAIIKYYATTNLNFKKKLKAIRKLNDTLFVLNYVCHINATKTLRTFIVSVENDTCRLVIEK